MGLRLQILAVVVVAGIAAGAVVAWQSSHPPTFAASSVLVVEAAPTSVATAGGRPENIVFLARRYAARALTSPVLADAIARSDLSTSVDELRRRTSVDVSTSDATIVIRGTGRTRRAAKVLTAAVSDALQRDARRSQRELRRAQVAPLQARIAQIERRLRTATGQSPQRFALEQEYRGLLTARAEAGLRPLDRIGVLSPPVAPSEPDSPQPVRAGGLAFLIAAVLGAEAVVVFRMIRRRRPAVVESVRPPAIGIDAVRPGPVGVDNPAPVSSSTAVAAG